MLEILIEAKSIKIDELLKNRKIGFKYQQTRFHY